MKILAIETTERIGSVALLDSTKLLYNKNLDPSKRSAESLAPAIRTALEEVSWHAHDIDLVATTIGPGSFTGLRVGVTTAKTFAYSAGADVLGLDTLEVIAAAVPSDVRRLAVAVDAQRGEVVAERFRRSPSGLMEATSPAALIDADTWLAGLEDGEQVAGPVLRKLAERLPAQVVALPAEYWAPTAGAVARLAQRHYAEGRRDNVWKLVPRYFRRSAAEEKWEASGR